MCPILSQVTRLLAMGIWIVAFLLGLTALLCYGTVRLAPIPENSTAVASAMSQGSPGLF